MAISWKVIISQYFIFNFNKYIEFTGTYCTWILSFVGTFQVMLSSCFAMAFLIQNGISWVLVDNELVGSQLFRFKS